MLKKTGPILIFLCIFAGNALPAVPRRSISDEQVVARAQLVANGLYVEIYQHGAVIEPSFLNLMESAYEEVQRVTGLKLDTATLGSKVRVYVSDAIRRLARMEVISSSERSQSHHFSQSQGVSRSHGGQKRDIRS
jgi:hypothetical protein